MNETSFILVKGIFALVTLDGSITLLYVGRKLISNMRHLSWMTRGERNAIGILIFGTSLMAGFQAFIVVILSKFPTSFDGLFTAVAVVIALIPGLLGWLCVRYAHKVRNF